jgi:hypothetical protein
MVVGASKLKVVYQANAISTSTLTLSMKLLTNTTWPVILAVLKENNYV